MKNNNEKGFTLVEIIVIIAIMALLLIPIASLMISNSKGIISANQNTDLQEKALQIMSAFRTNCLYTSNVESLTLNGISSEDTIFTVDLDNGFDQDSDGASFVMTVRKPTDAGYIRTVYTYDNSTNEFSIVDDGKSMLKVSDIIVSLQPIGKKNTTQFTFREAYGVKVTVELARDLDRISQKITLKDLSNAFYFRNSGVDINDLYMTPSPESSLPMPDPDNGDNVATPTPSATITPTDQPGSGGSSGEGSSGSGEGGSSGGSTGDSGSGEGGSSGGSTGGSGSGEGSSSGGSTGGSGSGEGGGSSSTTSPVPSSSPATPTVAPTDEQGIYITLQKVDNYGNNKYIVKDAEGNEITNNSWMTLQFSSTESFKNSNVERFSDNTIKRLDIYINCDESVDDAHSMEFNITLQPWNTWHSDAVVNIHNI